MTYYSILGVTPDAEDIVIKAAYRALAQRYHPDKWQGDPSEAQRRMAAINEAYEVLRDSVKRSEYDQGQYNTSDYFDPDNSQDTNAAFNAALKEVEERWEIACGIFPDLVIYRKNLQKISTQLAFSYVMYILESKLFNKREEIYENMEVKFLERFFGSNFKIISFAKELIQCGRKDDARKLNKLIDVMGENIDPNIIINQFDKKINNNSLELRNIFLSNTSYYNAYSFAKSLGFRIDEEEIGMFSPRTRVTVTLKTGERVVCADKQNFIEYIKENYCKLS